jgi:DNA repair protein RadD
MKSLRWYQAEAVEAAEAEIASRSQGGACVVLPTGSGKSLVMAEICRRTKGNVLVLAHRAELVRQNLSEYFQSCPTWKEQRECGMFCAKAGVKDYGRRVTFGSADTVANAVYDLPKPDVILVDECHRIKLEDTGRYRKILSARPCPVIGLTATPYRLSGGSITGPDFFLKKEIFRADVARLTREGFLSRVRLAAGGAGTALDCSKFRMRGGDFLSGEVEAEEMRVIAPAAEEAVKRLSGRKRIIWFCESLKAVAAVKNLLRAKGEAAEAVEGKLAMPERTRVYRDFADGRCRWLINCQVLCEGFDERRVDAVVMTRATASRSLHEQMLGRGMRVHPEKADCLLLDFAGNCERHGAIDQPFSAPTRLTSCVCGALYPTALGACPECGAPRPKADFARQAAEEAQKRRAANPVVKIYGGFILSDDTVLLPIKFSYARKHTSRSGNDCVRITHTPHIAAGSKSVDEYFFPQSQGSLGMKALRFWKDEMLIEEPMPLTPGGWAAYGEDLNARVLERSQCVEVGMQNGFPYVAKRYAMPYEEALAQWQAQRQAEGAA